jgi:hypothetical protein
LTVTLNVQVDVVPASSVAVQSTLVRPMGKKSPEAGEQLTLTVEQAELAAGSE